MLYAAYGSNLNHNQMARRCPKAKFIGRALLRDHRLVFRRFCDIEAAKGYVVPVGLWDVTPECMEALDRYEGYPSHYGRTRMEFALPNRKTLYAITYFMNCEGYEAPSAAYVDGVAEGYEHCNIPQHRLTEALEFCLQQVSDPDWPPQECAQDVQYFARESCTQ